MKDLEKLMMMGSQGAEKGQAMSKEDVMAKLDVIRELMEDMQSAMGGQVTSGLDELLGAPVKDGIVGGENVASTMAPSSVGEAQVDEPALSDSELEEDVAQEPSEPVEEPKMEKKSLMEEEDDSFFGKKKDKNKFR